MKKSLQEVGVTRNVWRLMILSGCLALMSLLGAGYEPTVSRSSPPQIHQVGWQGAMENLNQEVFLFYPQNDITRLFGSDREFADPFDHTVTDVFTPTVIAIEPHTHKITLSVVVKVSSGTYTVTVATISNTKTALYLSIPDQKGVLKTSHLPFCYMRAMRWGPGNRSFSAVIDYTVSDQMTWA